MKTLIYVEKNPSDNTLRHVSLELTYKAYNLMKDYSGEVIGVFAGSELPKDIESLFDYGMDRLLIYTHEKLEHLQSI